MSEIKLTNSTVIEDAFNNNNNIKCTEFPYEIVDIDSATNAKLLKDFNGERTGFIQVGPKKWFFPNEYRKNAEIYYQFQPRPDDVWVVTFPRSGTTWTQELVWLLANDLDYEKALKIDLGQRFPFFEYSSFFHPEVKNEFLKENSHSNQLSSLLEELSAPAWKTLAQTTERRFIKTHLPFQLLPPSLLKTGCKVIYVARNPKDVIVSFYHLNRLCRTQGYTKDFPTYWNYFRRGLQPWTPYWSHIQEGWERRNEDNFLFMFYEDMNRDLMSSMKKFAKFLGVSYSHEQFEKLEEHLNIENFKNNPSVNGHLWKKLGITLSEEEGFVRKGRSGGWRNYFVGELNDQADEWIAENLKKIDLRFPNENNN